MSDVTPTMLEGLRKMAVKLRRQSATMAEPNDNTGKALERRGLVVKIDSHNGWNHYQITDAGRALLEANPTP